MAFRAGGPLLGMLPAVYREELPIVIKSRWSPGGFIVAISTLSRKLQRLVVGVRGTLKILLVTTKASIWCIVVIAVVARCTFISYRCMCAIQGVVLVVDIKCSGIPIGIGRMA